MKERIKHLILLIILIGIDQLSKFWVRTNLINGKQIDIIPDGVLNFQYHQNNGAVWGIMSGKIDFLRIFTLIILLVIIFLYIKIPNGKRYQALKILAISIIAGAIGNLIDRFYLGYVVDFIYFELIDFPLFNFADMCLTISSFVLFFLAIFYYKDEDFVFLEKTFKGKKANINSEESNVNTIISEDTVVEEKIHEEETSDSVNTKGN